MPIYTITNKGNVIQCKWNCDKKHEHFEGPFESALKYFGGSPEEVKPYGKLINIIIFYQTSETVTIRRLSNELFDDLVYKQSTRRFYTQPKDREKNAIQALNDAYKLGIIYDEKLLSWLRTSKKYKDNKRAINYDEWIKEAGRNSWDLEY